MTIQYAVKNNKICITPCPFKTGSNVGSIHCKYNCKYCYGHSERFSYIKCAGTKPNLYYKFRCWLRKLYLDFRFTF